MALDWLNRTARKIAGSDPHWRFLEKTATFSTVASQMSYDLPSDIDLSGNKIISLKQNESPTKLIYIDQRSFDSLEPDPTTSSGYPYWYTTYGKYLRLYPVPDSAITIYMRYIKTIDNFADNSTEHADLPDKWQDVVLDGMKIHAFRYEPEWGNADNQMVVFEAGLKKMRDDNKITIDDDQVSWSHPFAPRQMQEAYHIDRTSVG